MAVFYAVVRGPISKGFNMKKAFTLIELLVVVLIIGILAAVALPQYQKAVTKSRFATIKHLTRSIAEAEEIYYLTTGNYTTDIGDLDIDVPATSSTISTGAGIYFFPFGYCILEIAATQDLVYCILSNEKNTDTSLSNRMMSYWIGLRHSKNSPGKRACYAYGNDKNSIQDKVCQTETGAASATYSSNTLRQWFYP